jgi:hypothetical protein
VATDLVGALHELGFKKSSRDVAVYERLAQASGMNDSGPYRVSDCFVKGDTVVLLEENVSTEDANGLRAVVTYPAVAVIEGPGGRVAVNPDDVDSVVYHAQLVQKGTP